MRIISGKFKGRRFNPPAKNWPTRPTSDFSKEGLFNMLDQQLNYPSLIALDLFGGTGSLSYELVSRGCENVTYVEKYIPCLRFVEKMKELLGISDEISIIRGDVAKFIKKAKSKYNFIIADPPYALVWLEDIPNLIFDRQLLLEDGLLVLEHGPNHVFENHQRFIRDRKYGSTVFSFFK